AGKRIWRISNSKLHDETQKMLQSLAEYFPVGVIEVHLVCKNLSEPLVGSNGAIVDVKLAPDIDDLAVSCPDIHANIAGAFVDWLFSEPSASRIPIVTVTGTNGKTSTCRLIDAVFKQAG